MPESQTATDRVNAALTLSLSDTLLDLGGISPNRLRSVRAAANTDDLAAAHRRGEMCELVDGVLAEKAMGFRESLLAMIIGHLLSLHVLPRQLGLVSGPDGFITLFPELVRGPDVAYTSWQRIPSRQLPTEAYPAIIPNLVIEIMSQGNTRAEMARKRREYFHAGVELVWMVDPLRRSVAVFTSSIQSIVLTEDQTLDGGHVLPGLSIPLPDVFAVLDGPDVAPSDEPNVC